MNRDVSDRGMVISQMSVSQMSVSEISERSDLSAARFLVHDFWCTL
jgi:hypothetical protein